MAHVPNSPEFRGEEAVRTVIDTHKGWTIARDHASGLMFIYRPNGHKYGQTQTEAGARIMRRRAIEGMTESI